MIVAYALWVLVAMVLIVGQGSHLGFDDHSVQLTDFTPQDLHVALERVVEVHIREAREPSSVHVTRVVL